MIGVGLALANTWAGGDVSAIGRAAALAAAVWAISALAGLGILVVASARQTDRLGMAMLASSMSRMLLALLIGLPLFLVVHADGKTFWTCFLLAGLLALAAETAWALRQLSLLTVSPAVPSTPGTGVVS